MATTLMPLDPATSPQQAMRVLNIAAHLLPDEVINARRAAKVRGAVIAVLLVVLVLLGGWYTYVVYQTAVAKNDLENVTDTAIALQQRQSQFANVVDVQGQTTVLGGQLSSLLAKDLRWATLLDTLRDTAAASDVTITGVSGALASTADGASPTGGLPSAAGVAAVGTLTVTGDAPDKTRLARFVDALGKLKVVANPYPTSATESGATETATTVQFSLQLDITPAALGGRFTKTTPGGK